jgi:hypothetical protein
MQPRVLTIACVAWSLSLGACEDDPADTGTSGAGSATFAGACDFASSATCDEYADGRASASTMGQCTGGGGVWTTGKCPFAGRTGVCLEVTGATRTYTYSEAAATALMGSCPAEKFKKIVVPGETGGAGGAGGTATTGGAGGTGPLTMPDAAADDDAGP